MLVAADVQRDVVVVDRVLDEPVPTRIAVAEVGPAHESAVRHVDQVVGNRDADLHPLDFVAPLILVRPPDARAFVLAGGRDPVMASCVLAERHPAESPLFLGLTRVVEIDRVFTPARSVDGKST